MYRDIIERAIEQFSAGILKILQLRQVKKEEEALQFIETELLKLTGMYLKNFLTFPEPIFENLISKKYKDTPDYLIHISDLLKEYAEIQLEKGEISESRFLFKRALGILTIASKNEKFSSNKKNLKRVKYLEKMTG